MKPALPAQSPQPELELVIPNPKLSFASHPLQRGADIRTIQELLGHQDVSTTDDLLGNTARCTYCAKAVPA